VGAPVSVRHLQVAPVKGMALTSVDRLALTHRGVEGDRAFSVHDGAGGVLTARRAGALLGVRPAWDPETGTLELVLPGGEVVRDAVRLGDRAEGVEFGRTLRGRVVEGPFGPALTRLLGRRAVLVRHDDDVMGCDEAPVTLVSRPSLDELARHAGRDAVDPRRFRMTVEIDGTAAREEDGWVGGEVAVGDATLRVLARTERCVITTRHPDTGDVDLPVLKVLAGYRGKDDVCMGVLCDVVRPGAVAVGDAVRPVAVAPRGGA
jgi:MOSC domain-containing protein